MNAPTTIISIGGAGAGRGALQAAAELGLKIAGWTTASWLPEDYREGLRTTLSPRMAARLNVQDSDGTLIVSFMPALAAGGPAAYADEAVEHQRKPSLHIVLPEGGRSAIPEDVRNGVLAWIVEEKIATLHVTGPREADEPGIQAAVRDALVWIFEDEVLQPSPRAQAFAEQVIGPMVAASLSDVDRSAAVESLPLLPETPPMTLIGPPEVCAAVAAGRTGLVLQLEAEGHITQKQAQALLEAPEMPAKPSIEREPHAGEFDNCDCPSHLDQDGNVTRRPPGG